MYVRSYARRHNGKIRGPYWQLTRGDWIDGKCRLTHVAYIGKAPDRAAAYFLARQKALLCGAVFCGLAGEVEISLSAGKTAKLCLDHSDDLHRAAAGDPKGCSVIVALAS